MGLEKEESTPEERKKSETALKEEEILTFWKEQKIFEKTLEKKSPKGKFVFYDGPPFATGLPHYGHVLPGTIKDAIPRYKTMQGYHVRRQWGWDCHGLPIENLVEKELGLATKKDIEEYGIDTFNEQARASVLRYADDWRKLIPRTGRWVDMERDYRTMDWTYTESVWWVFKTLYDKGLIYEGFKSMHICPRCETTLSNFEVSQEYKDVTDISVTVKLILANDPLTSLLVWTTTPWTLPGNAAVAVNKNLDYVKIKITNQGLGKDEQYILAKKRLGVIKTDYEIIEEFSGEKLVGKKYAPIFDYYVNDKKIGENENNWKVYEAPFVKSDEGTGIVHIAPAFGEDDMNLGKEHNLSLIQHVGMDGRFKEGVRDFPAMKVKPQDDPQATDIEIIKHLAKRNLLFAKEKITHAYPHCWRCDTPLLNYAAHSWFVKVTALKGKIVKENKKVKWVPEEIGSGRFEKGLLGAPDWAMSRSRFWGAPLPVWKCGKCDKSDVLSSVEELKTRTIHSGNKYFIMRHGEAKSNVELFVNSRVDASNTLTVKGKLQAEKAASRLKELLGKGSIDLIFASPLPRTKMTASIVAEKLGISEERVITDSDLREVEVGVFENEHVNTYHNFFSSFAEHFWKTPEGGENWMDVKRRMGIFLYGIEEKYENKNILIISHDSPLWMLSFAAVGKSTGEIVPKEESADFISNGEIQELLFTPLPHNRDFELDLHRPYVDEITFPCSCGGFFSRIPDVFDCWFESGAMPYGQRHYVFDEKKYLKTKDKKEFPADFIAESLDQTRGWFYSLLVLGVALFGESPYKNVVVSGLVLGEDGRKMSKKLKNYPELSYTLDRYGADALRFYLLSSPLVRADATSFKEKEVEEVHSKVVGRLRNVASFYKLYVNQESFDMAQGKFFDAAEDKSGGMNSKSSKEKSSNYQIIESTNVLDQWIMVRLDELVNKVTYGFEHYELDKATRPVANFIDDLSTWYLRRSRERFKSDNESDRIAAIETTTYVLRELSKVIAPCMPFIAEEVYQKARKENGPISVHLEMWPKGKPTLPVWPNVMAFIHRLFGTHNDLKLLSAMDEVRRFVTLALDARTRAGIKVRQPLASLEIRNLKSEIRNNDALLSLIKDEVNVKEISFRADIQSEVELDTEITPELKKEGNLREFIRALQDLRKNDGLLPGQKVVLHIKTSESGKHFVEEFGNKIKNVSSLSGIKWSDVRDGETISIGDFSLIVKFEYLPPHL